jgi:hypothetical protein
LTTLKAHKIILNSSLNISKEINMRHPFDLASEDLEFEESLSVSEAGTVGGGLMATTMAIGEEGGEPGFCWPKPRPRPRPRPKPIGPPDYTTLALGEEGGDIPPVMTTRAWGEEGGDGPPLIGPPEVTTMAIGEEGGDPSW